MTKKLVAMLVLGVGLAFPQVPVKPVDGNGTELAVAPPGKRFISYLQAITTSGTTITSNATYVQMLYCTNNSGSDRTITIADTQGSPATFATSVSIAANSIMMVVSNATGLYMQGVKITASANSAISCQLQGVQ